MAISDIKICCLGALCFVLVACGGGGGGSPQPASQPQPVPVATLAYMGDSITAFWNVQDCRPGINAGVAGETTGQMAARFNRDIIDAHATTVHILGGTNDLLAGNTSTSSVYAMAMTAKSAGVSVILGTVPPIDFAGTAIPANDTRVQTWNADIKQMAATNGFSVADYYPHMVTATGAQDTTLFKDNVHPNASGYAVMCAALHDVLH